MSSPRVEMNLRYDTLPCALGSVLLAATDAGVCCIELGDNAAQLAAALQQRFPRAQLTALNADEQNWLQQLATFIEQPEQALQLPLDIQGTPFQRQVWQVLRAIPLGATTSYADIAARIGKPRAARAVATACASNNLALAIPCHRVVRGSGELAGYRWGLERKRALLQRELQREAALKH